MTFNHTATMAWKYIRIHFRRYIFMVAILGLSFAIVMTVTGLTAAMSRNVFRAAESHYGGHVFVIGFDHGRDRVTDTTDLVAAIGSSTVSYRQIALRTMIYGKGVLYFGGNSVKQKYLFGIDWNGERELFTGLDYDGPPPALDGLENGIIISAGTAEELQARLDDDVLLELPGPGGRLNTATFVVRGILADKSVFGRYKCFISRDRLNAIAGYAPGDCSWIGLFLNRTDPASIASVAAGLHALLRDRFPMGVVVDTREDFTRELSRSGPDAAFRYSLVTLTAYISQVSDLLVGMSAISYALYVLMIVIAIASLTVTYRLILRERSRELGTVRVMGMKPSAVQGTLMLECLILFFIALAAGLVLSLAFAGAISLVSFSQIPGFDIFLFHGRLTAAFSPGLILTNALILLAAVFPAVWLPAHRVSRGDLSRVLSGGSRAA